MISVFRTKIKTKDGREILVREPRKKDLNEIWKFISAQIKDETADGLGMTKAPSLKEEKDWLENKLKDIKKKKTIYLLLERNGRVVGSSDIERKTGRQEHTANFGIVIDREYRGQGLGTKLMSIVLKLAKERMKGLKIIYLDCISYNRGAQKLYKKVGFKRVATIPSACMNKGKLYNKIVMIYYLRGG